MDKKLEKAINESKLLNEDAKLIYRQIAKSIPKKEAQELNQILKEEQKVALKIKAKTEQKREQANQEFYQNLGHTFKVAEKEAMAAEDSEEKAESELILKQLDEE